MRILLMFCLLFQVVLSDEAMFYEVIGSVKNPGKMKWDKRVTLAGAIRAAGGINKKVNVDQVTVTRNQKLYTNDLPNAYLEKVLIQAGDVIEVKRGEVVARLRAKQTVTIEATGVTKEEQAKINAIYSIDSKGMVTMWKIGAVKAEGKTTAEFSKSLAEAYKKAEVFETVVFQVVVAENPVIDDFQIFTIGGQVRSPGEKTWTKGITLYTAVQSAGGEPPYAAMNRVKLYRRGKAYHYDLGRKDHRDVKVYPQDAIEVPQTSVINR